MATKIVNCPSCSKPCTWHPLGGIQCVKCGYGCLHSEKPPIPTEEQNSPLNPNQAPTGPDSMKSMPDFIKIYVEPGKQINLF